MHADSALPNVCLHFGFAETVLYFHFFVKLNILIILVRPFGTLALALLTQEEIAMH